MIFDDDEEFPVSVPIADDLRRLQQENAALLKQSSEWEGKALERFVRIEELESENARLAAEVAELRKSLESMRCPETGLLSYAALRQVNANLRVRLAESEAIVAKLPKTKDGVPVVPGVRIYYPVESYDCCEVEAVRVDSVDMLGIGLDGQPFNQWRQTKPDGYSTREAAEAAKGGDDADET